MPLPSWAGKAPAKEYDYPVADSPYTATGYRIVYDEMGRTDHYTCVQPVDASVIPHPNVLRAIHEFDPSIIVLWRKQRYMPPGCTENEIETYTHLALGRCVKVPRRELILFNVEMPALGVDHPVPNELILVWEAFDERYFHEGGPGGHMPPDMSLYWFLREQFECMKSARVQTQEREIRIQENRERARKAIREDTEYRDKHFHAYMGKFWEKPGDSFSEFEKWKAKRQEELSKGAN